VRLGQTNLLNKSTSLLPDNSARLLRVWLVQTYRQHKSTSLLPENISKKNQFALFAFQRTLYLLAAFCGTIFLKLCNQKTRFILRLI